MESERRADIVARELASADCSGGLIENVSPTIPTGNGILGSDLQTRWQSLVANEAKARRKYHRWHEVIRKLEKDKTTLDRRLQSTPSPNAGAPPAELRGESENGQCSSQSPDVSATRRPRTSAADPQYFASLTPGPMRVSQKRCCSYKRCASMGDIDATAIHPLQSQPWGLVPNLQYSLADASLQSITSAYSMDSLSAAMDCGMNPAALAPERPGRVVMSAVSLPDIKIASVGDGLTRDVAMHSIQVPSHPGLSAVSPSAGSSGSHGSSGGIFKLGIKQTIKQAVVMATGVEKAKKKFASTLRKTVMTQPKPKTPDSRHIPEQPDPLSSSNEDLSCSLDGWHGAIERYSPYFETGAKSVKNDA